MLKSLFNFPEQNVYIIAVTYLFQVEFVNYKVQLPNKNKPEQFLAWSSKKVVQHATREVHIKKVNKIKVTIFLANAKSFTYESDEFSKFSKHIFANSTH